MIKKFKKLFIGFAAFVALAAPLAIPVSVYAAPGDGNLQGSLCGGVDLNISGGGTCVNQEADTQVNDTIKLALNLFSAVVGIIAVVMIIVGGIQYITSGGDSGNVTKAKNTILYAVIGLVVVALAQIIVKFVLNRFVGN